MMLIETLVVGPLQVNCFIVGSETSGKAAVIDPGDEGERILQSLERMGLELDLIINTHGHFDHVGGNRILKEKTGAELLMHEQDLPLLRRASDHAALYGLSAVPSPDPDRLLKGGDLLSLGEMKMQVIHTPGHSPGGICILAGGHLFSGDALFAGSVGRTDLPGGSHQRLIDSIREKLLVLPDDTVVHPGHGPDTTIGREKKSNPFL